LVAVLGGGRKGYGGGEYGLLIAVAWWPITREKLVGALLRRVPFPERREETVEVMMLTCGSRRAVTERGGEGYPFGIWLDGPWAETRAGPDWLPGAFLYFYFVFFFSFSVFLFLLYLLQKCFNSIQTTIRNFLKIKTTFQNSNKHGFNIKSNFQIKLYNLDKGLICINQSRNRILK
jgi:hypothetical protein